MTANPIADAAARFARDTAKHQLTVLHEDGLYRHLRAQQPGTGHCWFDLITWPGTLTIKGDMGTYVFSRAQDMLDFFRRSAWAGQPNLQYWEEKLDAGDTRTGVRAHSEQLLRQHIAEDVTAEAEVDLRRRLQAAASELGTSVEKLPSSTAARCRTEHAAYMAGLAEALEDDLLGEFSGWALDDEGDALAGARQFEYLPDDAPRRDQSFTFEPSEWTTREHTPHYIWCCHAILWAIAAYDRAKAEQPAAELVAAATTSVEV